MWPTSEVVVVLPFEPVMATKRPRRKRQASSISLHTGMPRARAAARPGSVGGTPGLGTIRSCARKVSLRWPPSSSVQPASRSFAAASPSSAAARSSVAVTRAPRAAQNSAVATPVRASPTTSTRLPASSMPGRNALHLNFSVVSENSANTSATIQNRTMIFDSLQPASSK